MRSIAITREVPRSIQQCELTFQERVPIDLARARAQHAAYQRTLEKHGYDVVQLPEAPDLADSVFVEDVAIIFDECAVITRPGAASRRAEIPSIRSVLERYRTPHELKEPATLDGGDVLRLGRRVFVGLSTRTNQEGVAQLTALLAPFRYEVIPVAVNGALHLKSVVTAVAADLIVVDSQAIEPAVFGVRYIEVPSEAANMLRLKDAILCPVGGATAAEQLAAEGLRVELVDNSELAKAEGALTCCSLLID